MPTDGVVNPTDATMAIAKRAKENGKICSKKDIPSFGYLRNLSVFMSFLGVKKNGFQEKFYDNELKVNDKILH